MPDPKRDRRQTDLIFFIRVALRGKELLDSLCVSVGMPVGRGRGGSSVTVRGWRDGLWDKGRSLVTGLKVVVVYSFDQRHLLRNRHNCC